MKIKLYIQLMRLDKPIGILLLLWPTYWALWASVKGTPNLLLLVIFSLAVVIARSASCIINDIADRKFDGFVKRTATRPLATGAIPLFHAYLLFVILVIVLIYLITFLNVFALLILLISIAMMIIYPFSKRFTYFPQVFLGITFNMSILIVYAAHINELPIGAWLLFVSGTLLTIAYDTIYAMVDKPDDIKIDIKSTAIFFEQYERHFIAILHLLALIGFVSTGLYLNEHINYYLFLLLALACACYQLLLIKNRNTKDCFNAFLYNGLYGFFVFLGFLFG